MFINLSNHPSAKWLPEQTETAVRSYGDICDLPFPNIRPEASDAEVKDLANAYFRTIRQMAEPAKDAIHVMGEMTFTFALVQLLKADGYTCVASTTRREVVETGLDTRIATFRFVQFRPY